MLCAVRDATPPASQTFLTSYNCEPIAQYFAREKQVDYFNNNKVESTPSPVTTYISPFPP